VLGLARAIPATATSASVRAGALAATIAHTVPAPLAATIAGPLAGIVAHAVAIFVNRVRPGALVLACALPRIVTDAVAICIHRRAGALALTRPLALLGKDGRCSGNQRDEREGNDEGGSEGSGVHDVFSFVYVRLAHP
jgi:hypothetical protein